MGRHRVEFDEGARKRPNGGPRIPQERRTRTTERAMTIEFGRPPPTDQRGFLHKKLLPIFKTLAGGASFAPGRVGEIARGITRRFVPGGSIATSFVPVPARPTSPRSTTARVSRFSEAEKEKGQFAKFADPVPFTGPAPFSPGSVKNQGGCADPALIMAPDGHCVAPGSPHWRRHFGGGGGGVPFVEAGEAMMGRFGAGLSPTFQTIQRSVCLRGMTLGLDGLCYNKGSISNKQRMWPRGRRPLLTGGDMRAISIASRAGARLERTATRLRGLGLMKQLPKGRSKKCPPRHPGAPGMTVVQN